MLNFHLIVVVHYDCFIYFEVMKLTGFGKVPRHRKFDYIPRHYDPEKEALLDRVDRHSPDKSNSDKMKARITDSLRQGYVGDASYRKALVKKSNMRLFYIIVLLVIISYFVLGSDKITEVLKSIQG